MTQGSAGDGNTPGQLYRGYDGIASGMLNENAVTGTCDKTGGVETFVKIKVCKSLTELARALEIDASLSVSYLRAANVTAKMSFMNKLDATTRSVTIVVYAKKQVGTWTAGQVGLAAGVNAPTNDDETADFVAIYGDSYVSSATQGGEYYAAYTFRTETQTEQKELSASLEGVFASDTVDASAQLKLSDFLKTTKTSWSFEQGMTGTAKLAYPSQDRMIQFALDFPSKELESPVTTAFKISGYESVRGIGPRKFGKVMDNRDHFLDTNGVLYSYARLKGIENQVKWLNGIYDRYKFNDPTLEKFAQDLADDLETIDNQVKAYRRDATQHFPKPTFKTQKEPVLTVTAGQPASFGSEGGGDFKFMSPDEAIRNQVRIVSIQLADDNKLIRRLIVTYASDKGSPWTVTHGDGGATREMFYLQEGQFLSRIAGRADTYVDRLEFYTPDGRSTWAGGMGGNSFDWITPAGTVVLGFAGRAGLNLDQIKIIHAKLEPARYVQPR